jgi:hypothetical protein
MTAVDMDLVIWVNVTVSMDIKELTVPRVFALYFVRHMVIMEVEFVIVKTDTKDLNATYQQMNVKCQHARIMEDALKVNATAIVDGKDLFAIKLIVKIQHAQAMEVVYQVNVSVKLDGRAMIAQRETNKSTNAFQVAQIMDIMTWRLHLVYVIVIGLAMTVHKLYVA